MKKTICHSRQQFAVLWVVLIMSISLCSCGSYIRKYVNNSYPPVSSVEKSHLAVQRSIEQIRKLSTVQLGARISQSTLSSSFRAYFNQAYAKDSTLGIQGVERIEIINAPEIHFAQQEMISTGKMKIFLKNNKYLRDITIDFSGRLAPFISSDSLVLKPGFEKIYISDVKLRKWIFLGRPARRAVNMLVQTFRDNINGQIKDFIVKLNYKPFPEIPVSKLLGADGNVSVVKDDTFRIQQRILKPVILIENDDISILSEISTGKLSSISPAALNNEVQVEVENTETSPGAGQSLPGDFQSDYQLLDSLFYTTWNHSLDSIQHSDTSTRLQLSYTALSDITDELFKDVQFGIKYKINQDKPFPTKDIELGEIKKPDCNSIGFDCDFRNCSSEMRSCPSCKWYQVDCHARKVACEVENAGRWTLCQAANVARGTWCAAQLTARRGLCYTTLAGIFIYDNLVKKVGSFGGNASANGEITAFINKIDPGGISSISMNGNVNANVDADVKIIFNPSGLLGHLACNFPVNETFHFNNIHLATNNFKLAATIDRVSEGENRNLKIRMNELTIPIQLSQPLLVEILKKPGLILNCGFSLGAGLTLTSVLALTGNEQFKNYLNTVLFGIYTMKFRQDFTINVPVLDLNNNVVQLHLTPDWGTKSLVYK